MRTLKKYNAPLLPKHRTPSEGYKVLKAGAALGLSPVALAEALDVSRGTVYSYAARSNANPSPDKLRRFNAQYCSWVPLDWFYNGIDDAFPAKPEAEGRELRSFDVGRIAVFGAAAAGDSNGYQPDASYLEVPIQMARPHYRAWIVRGDSMMPFLWEYDTITIDPTREVRVGEVGVFFLDDDPASVLIKQLKHDGQQYVLHSLNPAYSDQSVNGYRSGGLIVGFWREAGGEYAMRFNPRGLRAEM